MLADTNSVEQMVPIPEGVERDEEEPKEDELSDDTSVTSGETRGVDLKIQRRWAHKGPEELMLID